MDALVTIMMITLCWEMFKGSKQTGSPSNKYLFRSPLDGGPENQNVKRINKESPRAGQSRAGGGAGCGGRIPRKEGFKPWTMGAV